MTKIFTYSTLNIFKFKSCFFFQKVYNCFEILFESCTKNHGNRNTSEKKYILNIELHDSSCKFINFDIRIFLGIHLRVSNQEQ